MSDQDYQVIHYLKALKKFLYGDLEEFKKLAALKESEEDLLRKAIPSIVFSETSSLNPNTSTTTTETTAPPSVQLPATTSTPTAAPTTTPTNFQTNTEEQPTFYRSTIPHSLVVFATIDLTGALLRQGNIFSDTANNMREFLLPYNFNEDQLKFLTKFYRHGMAHSFFPKQRLGVSYHSSNEGKGLFFEENGMISLNVNLLIKITKERLNSIIELETLHANLQSQFEILENSDKNYLDANINISNLF